MKPFYITAKELFPQYATMKEAMKLTRLFADTNPGTYRYVYIAVAKVIARSQPLILETEEVEDVTIKVGGEE